MKALPILLFCMTLNAPTVFFHPRSWVEDMQARVPSEKTRIVRKGLKELLITGQCIGMQEAGRCWHFCKGIRNEKGNLRKWR